MPMRNHQPGPARPRVTQVLLSAAFVGFACALAARAQDVTYDVTAIADPQSYGTSLNNTGTVVGFTYVSPTAYNAFFNTSSGPTYLGSLGGASG